MQAAERAPDERAREMPCRQYGKSGWGQNKCKEDQPAQPYDERQQHQITEK